MSRYEYIEQIMLDPRYAVTEMKITCGDTFSLFILLDGKKLARSYITGLDLGKMLDKLNLVCKDIIGD
jgi:hypothetical protein